MDRARFSAIAHSTHTFCNPIGDDKIEQALALLSLGPGSRFLDAGAGKGEIAARLARRSGASGVAVDHSPLMAAECRRRAAELGPGRLEVIEGDAGAVIRGLGLFDAALCVGSAHALGGLRAALRALASSLRPAGLLLIGEGYWKRPPEGEYLRALHAEADAYDTHAGNLALLRQNGYRPLWAWTASEDEWDQYEWRYAWNIETFAAEHPDDPDREAMIARSRAWSETVQRWGRDTLGFGLYLARRG